MYEIFAFFYDIDRNLQSSLLLLTKTFNQVLDSLHRLSIDIIKQFFLQLFKPCPQLKEEKNKIEKKTQKNNKRKHQGQAVTIPNQSGENRLVWGKGEKQDLFLFIEKSHLQFNKNEPLFQIRFSCLGNTRKAFSVLLSHPFFPIFLLRY